MQEKRAFAAAEVVTGGCLLVTGGKAGDGRVSDTMEVTAYTAHRPHSPNFHHAADHQVVGSNCSSWTPDYSNTFPSPRSPRTVFGSRSLNHEE